MKGKQQREGRHCRRPSYPKPRVKDLGFRFFRARHTTLLRSPVQEERSIPFWPDTLPHSALNAIPLRFPLPTVVLIAGLLLFSGCDDPSNVGQGLLDAQSGDTQVVTLAPDNISPGARADVTGGNAASGALRALAGMVNDPVIGPLEATGFLDFVPSSQFDGSFLNGTVSWAELSLNMDYRYGDTTGVVSLDLYGVTENWLSSETDADSDIAMGDLIASYEVQVKEGVVSLPLPEAWINEHDATLRSSTFTDSFHGFGLVPTDGDAIVGFRFSESSLRASAVAGDTVSFALSKVGTLTDFSGATTPEGHILLQDGAEKGMDLRFPLRNGELDESLIHRVVMNLDTVDLLSQYPAGFARPVPGVIGIEAVSADGLTRLPVAEVSINSEGSFVIANTTLTNVFQSANLGKSVLDRFEIYFPPEQSGVGFFAFQQDGNSNAIEALITSTSIN